MKLALVLNELEKSYNAGTLTEISLSNTPRIYAKVSQYGENIFLGVGGYSGNYYNGFNFLGDEWRTFRYVFPQIYEYVIPYVKGNAPETAAPYASQANGALQHKDNVVSGNAPETAAPYASQPNGALQHKDNVVSGNAPETAAPYASQPNGALQHKDNIVSGNAPETSALTPPNGTLPHMVNDVSEMK